MYFEAFILILLPPRKITLLMSCLSLPKIFSNSLTPSGVEIIYTESSSFKISFPLE